MAVAEDDRGSERRPRRRRRSPKRLREEPRPPRVHVGSVLRLLVFVALAAFLLYYVGPRDIAETALKVALAVALTAALWVGANLLFDQAYDHWTRFNTIIGVAARLRRLLRRRVERLAQDACRRAGAARRSGRVRRRHRLAHAAARRQRPALGADRRRRPRVGDVPAQRPAPAARPPPAGRARVHRLRAAHRLRPRRVGVPGARLGQAVDLRRRRRGGVRADRPLALRARGCPALGHHRGRRRLARRRVGRRRHRRRQLRRSRLATVVPAAILGARFGLAAEPDAQKRRRIDQRSRSWIFVTPALALHRHRAAGPADPHDLPLVPQPQRHRVRRVGQLHGRSSPTRTR